MRLADMLLREDFYKILRDTVTDYYFRVHGQEIIFSYQKERSCEKLLINGKLGFVSRFPAPTGLRRFLLAEYNIRGSCLKYLIGKAAAWVVSVLPQIGQLKSVYITSGVLGKNTFISPQNRSIRFFDYESMTVDCIVKASFTDRYFSNQLTFRKKYHYDFMLPLLESGERWFREPILLGHPLVRVTDENIYQKGLDDALRGIGRLAKDTISYEDSYGYGKKLLERIETILPVACQRKHISCVDQTRYLAKFAWQTLVRGPIEIPVCMSHGDFQSGNIWVDEKGKTWLYDWETVERRSIWYDSAVLNYSLRRVYGWQNFWTEKRPVAICACDLKKDYGEEAYKSMKSIILLEDILFYLEDMLELPDDWGKDIYEAYIWRMARLLVPME